MFHAPIVGGEGHGPSPIICIARPCRSIRQICQRWQITVSSIG
jgi:hypothetical protein